MSRLWLFDRFEETVPVRGRLRDRTATVPGEHDWEWDGTETMNPFWAVRRLSESQMKKEAPQEQHQIHCRFNCKLVIKNVSAFTVLTDTNSEGGSGCRIVEVPFITNSEDLDEGEELILQIDELILPKKAKQIAKKRTWKDDHH